MDTFAPSRAVDGEPYASASLGVLGAHCSSCGRRGSCRQPAGEYSTHKCRTTPTTINYIMQERADGGGVMDKI